MEFEGGGDGFADIGIYEGRSLKRLGVSIRPVKTVFGTGTSSQGRLRSRSRPRGCLRGGTWRWGGGRRKQSGDELISE